MAFPTSPSNNDIHKEGNRAWVYDSTLSVWNQVPEFDTYPFVEPPNLTNTMPGVVSRGIQDRSVFPIGHVLQTVHSRSTQTSISHTNGNTYTGAGFPCEMTAVQTNGKYYATFFTGRIDANATNNRMCVTLFTKGQNDAGYSECAGISAATGLNLEQNPTYTGSAHFSYVYQATVTAGHTIAFQVYYKKLTGDGSSVHLTNGGNEFEFIVQELAL